ncbi:MAG: acyltransferase [Legionellaceae bacterium]|nr:acyltransferase [Legionellaceae bacterium]
MVKYFLSFGISLIYIMSVKSNASLTKSVDIPGLTTLRFFAAFFVFLSHALHQLMPLQGIQPEWLVFFSSLYAEGMTLFFVLSGFVIHYNYSNMLHKSSEGIWNFFVARLTRIYPLFLLAICYDSITHNSMESIKSFASVVPYYLTLTQSWFYIPFEDKSLIYQFGDILCISWSVSTEWFLYMLYPFICFLLAKVHKLSSLVTIFSIICLVSTTVLGLVYVNEVSINDWAVAIFGAVADISTGNSFLRWLLYFSPYTRMLEFLLGCVTASIYMRLNTKLISQKEQLFGGFILSICVIYIGILHYFAFSPNALIKLLAYQNYLEQFATCFGFAPSMAFIVFYCARYSNVVTRFFQTRILVIAGEASYSLYLFHIAIVYAVARETVILSSDSPFTSYLGDFSRLLFAFFSSIGLAIIIYHLFEVPVQRFLRKTLTVYRKKSAIVLLDV